MYTSNKERNMAMVSYLTVIGLIIAFISTKNRSDYLNFHLKHAVYINALYIFISIAIRYTTSTYVLYFLGIFRWITVILDIFCIIQAYHWKLQRSGKWVVKKLEADE